MGLLLAVGSTARLLEKAKGQRRLRHLEQERALERERARIARDLHDDLGSSLTRISLLSGLAKADKENPRQVEVHMNKISQSAEQTVRALEEIVWAVRRAVIRCRVWWNTLRILPMSCLKAMAPVAGLICPTISPPGHCRRMSATLFSWSSKRR